MCHCAGRRAAKSTHPLTAPATRHDRPAVHLVMKKLETEGALAGVYVHMEAEEAAAWLWDRYGIQAKAQRLETEKDDTFKIEPVSGPRVILKVSNPHESLDEIQFQTELLRHVALHAPALPTPRTFKGVGSAEIQELWDRAG